ncbi:methylated-DNA--[protein]-cysteine S-methyltransferase [Jatrophihabitans endophyticus]|uniref:methylated-DNA--[protein]-cysteine S-methyltransferase n=1 Tax=Jatrophihabitans endophyticus TaxID=1206085 RepID=UPI001A09B631|nr:methylated-DNA--[protein]-cysteine S-methyltransferase [Jatrophihabitans endophyticus]MBE7189184.1 methylated-DNA--[protein]-cysteine S-methyltransferase [Jatrophihabitans endophyticus]
MTDTLWTKIDSPVGPLLVARSAQPPRPITALYLPSGKHPTEPAAGWIEDDDAFDDVRAQLAEYFAGDRLEFDLPLDAAGTAFQHSVWEALRAIPYGETRTYGQQALAIGLPTAVRAVGAANGRNPISIIVPCHRVIGADGSLTGYGGGVEAKRWLLGHESGRPAQAELFSR